MTTKRERPVLVTTAHRGVFFGYAPGPTEGTVIELRRARNCVYWSAHDCTVKWQKRVPENVRDKIAARRVLWPGEPPEAA